MFDDPPLYDEVAEVQHFSPHINRLKPNWSVSINSLPSYDEAINGYASHKPKPLATRSSLYACCPCPSSVMMAPNHELFDASYDANILRNAVIVADKKRIIDILCHRSEEERLEITRLYHRLYGMPLPRTIKNHISISSNFSVLMCGLSMPLHEFMARAVHNSHSYLWMCHVMFVLPNNVRAAMKSYFESKYGVSMSTFIQSKISKSHKEKIYESQIIVLIDTERDMDNTISQLSVSRDTSMLLGVRDNKTFKNNLTHMFYTKSFEHIKAVCAEYEKKSHNTIDNRFIQRNFANHAFSIQNILDYTRNPVKYFASVLKQSMKGAGTNVTLLTSVIIMRCDIDLIAIKIEFDKANNNNLRAWIKENTIGYYKYALYHLIREDRITDIENHPWLQISTVLRSG